MKNFRKTCRGEKGFTLIELLVVIIILGVLAAVVTLAVTEVHREGRQGISECRGGTCTRLP